MSRLANPGDRVSDSVTQQAASAYAKVNAPYKLRDLVVIEHGYAFKGEFFTEQETTDILVTPGNFHIGGGFKNDKLKYYSGSVPNRYVLSAGAVIVTMTDLSKLADTLGYAAKVPKSLDSRYLHNQRIGLVRLTDESFDLDYIYWLMRARHYQRFVAGSATGATVKHTSPTKIGAFKFRAPSDKRTQQKIAALLSAYDDLIEINLRRIKLLEEMAQITYEEWFVRLKFPGHEHVPVDAETGLPEGWCKKRLNKVFELQRGFDLPVQDRVEGEVPVYASTGRIDYHNQAKVNGPGVVTGRSGTIGEVSYIYEDHWPLNTALWVKKFHNCGPIFVYHFLSNFDLARLGGGSAVPSLDRKVVHSQLINVPDKKLVLDFENIAQVWFEAIRLLRQQNQLLKEARDILLPRLMTGLIDVKNLEVPQALLDRLQSSPGSDQVNPAA